MTASTAIPATRVAAFVAVLVALPAASGAQTAPSVPLPNVEAAAAFEALAMECFDAGMFADRPSESIMDCTAILQERSSGNATADADAEDTDVADDTVIIRHRLRFTSLERAGELTITADAWTEIEELGTVVEEPITSDEYLRRVEDVVADVGERLRASERVRPRWTGRYDSEQAWHLDAHLHAVNHCNATLASMRPDGLREQLESIGVLPRHTDTRDLCEHLYQVIFEWGLAAGDAEPTVEKYARYRAALPPGQRPCSGRLALQATCR